MRNKILIAILAASTGWGLAGVGTRAAYSLGATTLTVLVVRTAIASLVLLIYMLGTKSRSSNLAWRHGALIGALRTGLAPMFFMASLNFISAGVEGLVITLVPATTAVMAALFIRERITGRQIAGLMIGLVGTTMIVMTPVWVQRATSSQDSFWQASVCCLDRSPVSYSANTHRFTTRSPLLSRCSSLARSFRSR